MNKDSMVVCSGSMFPGCCGLRIITHVSFASSFGGHKFSDIIKALTYPTILCSRVNGGGPPQYIQAAIEVCIENDIPYIAAPSFIHPDNSHSACASIIIYPNNVRLTKTHLSYSTTEPDCANITYTSATL